MSTTAPTVYRVLFAISLVHLLNDSLQAVIPAVLPILQKSMALTYSQLGMILFVMNVTASILQPLVGYVADRKPQPFILPAAMLLSGTGMILIAFASDYYTILLAVALLGFGSAIFHPEASRVVYLASGHRRGLSQSIFQVGGNTGSALGPLMSVAIFVPFGQTGAGWFTISAMLALTVLLFVAFWYRRQQVKAKARMLVTPLNYRHKRLIAIGILITIISVRSWLYSGMQGFYPLYLINIMGMPINQAQFHAFLFLLAGAVGTFFGGPLADRFGKRNMFIFSTLGAMPLTLLLPYAEGFWAYPLLVIDGLILLSSFSVSVVYAQELLPGQIGMVSGLIIGFSFGMGGIGSSVLGWLADMQGLFFVMVLCSFMPLIGVLGFLLPKDSLLQDWEAEIKAKEAIA